MPQHSVDSPDSDSRNAPTLDDGGFHAPEEARALVDAEAFDASSEEYAQDFAEWVEGRRTQMATRWGALVAQRTGRTDEPLDPLLKRFFDLTLQLLPACLGPYRSQFIPLFRTLAELYGSMGATRGLAAGEIIEEVQLLREVLIRRLFAEPPAFRRAPVLLREILRLNRMVDRAVTFASVGHTDAMFFSLFQGSGIPAQLTEELRAELSEQFDAIEAEASDLQRILSQQ